MTCALTSSRADDHVLRQLVLLQVVARSDAGKRIELHRSFDKAVLTDLFATARPGCPGELLSLVMQATASGNVLSHDPTIYDEFAR